MKNKIRVADRAPFRELPFSNEDSGLRIRIGYGFEEFSLARQTRPTMEGARHVGKSSTSANQRRKEKMLPPTRKPSARESSRFSEYRVRCPTISGDDTRASNRHRRVRSADRTGKVIRERVNTCQVDLVAEAED